MANPRSRLRLISDVGGVIVDHDNAKMFERVAALFDAKPSHAELQAAINGSGIAAGRQTPRELFDGLRRRNGGGTSFEAFLEALCCHFTLKPDVYALYRELRASGPIVLCSNTNAAHWDFVEARFGLEKLAVASILSHVCKVQKPSAEIYLLAAAAHGCAPAECLFVDDSRAYVEAADALGFRTHLFAGVDGLRRALQERA